MKKSILAIIALLVIVGFVLYSHLGGAVKSIIETAGTQALGTPVHVGSVGVSLATRTASINGISVDNPPGFNGKFLETKSVSATLGSVDKKTVTIKEVVVDGLNLTYDYKPGGTNFEAIEKHLKSAPAAAPAATPAENARVDKDARNGGYSVIIHQLRVTNAKVIASVGGVQRSISVPELVVNDIGSNDHPATPEEVARELMQHVIAIAAGATTKFSLSALPTGVNTGKVKDTLKGLFSTK